jgi:hypothetical protein
MKVREREKETIKSYFFAVSDNAHTLNNNNLM